MTTAPTSAHTCPVAVRNVSTFLTGASLQLAELERTLLKGGEHTIVDAREDRELVVQVHYNMASAGSAGRTDQTTVKLRLVGADTEPVLPGWGTRNEMCLSVMMLAFPPGVFP